MHGFDVVTFSGGGGGIADGGGGGCAAGGDTHKTNQASCFGP